MHWFSLSLATALAAAAEAAYLKRRFPDLAPLETALYPLAYSIPYLALLLAFLVLSGPLPATAPDFPRTCALLLPVNMTGMILYYRALSLSPLSLTLPYLSFTPAFTLAAAWPILGEVPNLWGAAGILVIVAGCYILHLDTRRRGGWAAPLKAATAEPGSRSMLWAAMLFGLSSTLGRKGILESDPLFFTASFFLAQALATTALLGIAGGTGLSCLRRTPARGLVLGGLLFLHVLLHSLAVSLVKTAYMIAVKRLSAVFGVALGGLWLGEENVRAKLAGAGLMVLGAAVVGLLGS